MSKLVALEAELAEYQAGLKDSIEYVELFPEDVEAKETKAYLEDQIAAVTAQIAEERARQTAAAPPPPPPVDDEAAHPPPPPPKYDMSKHPKFRKPSPETAPPPPPDETPQVFHVKDTVLAKYSGDKSFYPATIISKTGSAADPVYTVSFKGYHDTETKRKHEIRPVHPIESKKRRADGSPIAAAAAAATSPAPASPHPPTTAHGGAGGHIISAAPSVDTSLVPPKREPSKVSDGPTRLAPEPKKLKGQKQLQKNQSNWQSWASTGPKHFGRGGGGGGGGAGGGGFAGGGDGRKKKKESMFRTPDLPNAKVGFTGSGKPMQKDQVKRKWNYGGGAAGGDGDE